MSWLLDLLEMIPVIGKIIGLFRSKAPTDDPLARVDAAVVAEKKVDNSKKAIDSDPNNLDAPHSS